MKALVADSRRGRVGQVADEDAQSVEEHRQCAIKDVGTLLEEMTESCAQEQPDDTVGFMLSWLERRQASGRHFFDNGKPVDKPTANAGLAASGASAASVITEIASVAADSQVANSRGAKGKGKAGPGSKGALPKGGGAPALSYKEKQAKELAQLEEKLSAEEGFKGKTLTAWEVKVLDEGATDQTEGPYGGRKFLPSRGYFACKRCGTVAYLWCAKFVH